MRTSMAAAAAGLVLLAAVAVLNAKRAERAGALLAEPSGTDRGVIALPPVTALGCPDWTGMSAELEANVRLPTPGHPHRSVVSWYCLDAIGARRPSMVVVAEPDPRTGTARVAATLVRLRDTLHVEALAVIGVRISVTATYWGDEPGRFIPGWRNRGGMATIGFRSADGGRHYTADRPLAVAAACQARDLAQELSPGPDPAAPSWLIRFTNRTPRACVLEGYPTAQPREGPTLISRSWQTMHGLRGGVLAPVPPILLLKPGDTATSVLEPDDSEGIGGCAADHLAVGPPDGNTERVFPIDLSWCNPQVHPFVAGTTGSVP